VVIIIIIITEFLVVLPDFNVHLRRYALLCFIWTADKYFFMQFTLCYQKGSDNY